VYKYLCDRPGEKNDKRGSDGRRKESKEGRPGPGNCAMMGPAPRKYICI